jgi:hypothetical protein
MKDWAHLSFSKYLLLVSAVLSSALAMGWTAKV